MGGPRRGTAGTGHAHRGGGGGRRDGAHAAHEHEWTRCPECKQRGQPCPCSGTVCCEAERREIAAAAESATEGRERIACYIDYSLRTTPRTCSPLRAPAAMRSAGPHAARLPERGARRSARGSTMSDDREPLGRLVRETWVEWARSSPGRKASWLSSGKTATTASARSTCASGRL